VLLAACSSFLGDTPVDSSPGPGSSSGETTTTELPASRCIRFTGNHSTNIDTGSLATDALYLSGETFICADDVVVVGERDLNEIAAASQLAAALSGPLLFPEPRLAAELGRLKPKRVHLVGPVQVNVPDSAETVDHDVSSAVDLARETLDVSQEVSLPVQADASTVVETVLAIAGGDRVTVPQEAVPSSSTTIAPDPIDPVAIILGLATPTDASSLWMVDAASPATVLLASSVGRSIDASVLAVDGSDILGHPEVGTTIAGHSSETIRYIGKAPDASDWELSVLARGQQVPGGGYYVLPPDQPRRYLSYYGHPGTAALGVLGEQGPAETRAKMQDFMDAYAGDGAQVIATYEIIATVASASAGDDGDYSTEWPPDSFDEWIAFAADNDMYVVLDLQPGREDFLSQAKLYEDLLKLPFVGLALDPEWRLTDTQVHLQQTGTVDAVEINETLNWLADLVRDNGLPQKMFVLHQFKTSMITNRETIDSRPELQVVVQMDGDGTEAQKDATWSTLMAGASDAHWAWGWKNFFDEDEPGPPSPQSTISKVPTPVYVSYQ
jgi:hypothetical protein